jgi:hypothetical protein
MRYFVTQIRGIVSQAAPELKFDMDQISDAFDMSCQYNIPDESLQFVGQPKKKTIWPVGKFMNLGLSQLAQSKHMT